MSRVGKVPIPVPGGVEITVSGQEVTVKGPKGSLRRTFEDRVGVEVIDGRCVVTRINDERRSRALHGLTRALVNNMVIGVTEGYRKTLKIVGVGYRALSRGEGLELQVGYSHSVAVPATDGISFTVPDATTIVVEGIDKEKVGQVAAEIRRVRPPEPYKGKGIRYQDEYVLRKSGKAGVTVR
ncbi:MAG: 50S ribosomal protein L6 [Acidimicrobiia bacterium]|nr:50S ribosomal protein L6 [Acidimicrobiia bacterium]MYF84839.1 50S ribosomal protein L6 [Acidimicrobiia bacterium]